MRKGQVVSIEVRKRMSAARKKALADPEVRRKIENRGNIVCSACAEGNCLACNGGKCRCICALELDQKRKRVA